MEAYQERKEKAFRICSGLLLREMASIPFGKVPGPPGALKKGDGLKAQWTFMLSVSGSTPGSLGNRVSAKGLG
jgi:hypothetical protein